MDCPKMNVFSAVYQPCDEEDEITYRQWVRTDCTEIKTITTLKGEFNTLFESYIPKIREHEFINRKQNAYIAKLKNETIKREAGVCHC